MRLLAVLFAVTICLASLCTQAQDPGAMAAQQAAQQATQQATQQAIADTQQASQNAQQQAQLAAQNSGNDWSPRPSFSVKHGTYTGPVNVSLKGYRNSAIFYTLDGSKPTAKSTAYTGPITVQSTTTIKAIAILPRYYPSAVAKAAYVITPPKP